MKLTVDSPELTAYALQQLPTEQRAEVEAAIANSPELLAEVESIAAMSSLLARELANESALGLSPNARESILTPRISQAIETPEPSPAFTPVDSITPTNWIARWLRWRTGLGIGLGFGIAGLAALVFALVPSSTQFARLQSSPRTFAPEDALTGPTQNSLATTPLPQPQTMESSGPVASSLPQPALSTPTTVALDTAESVISPSQPQPTLAQRYGLKRTDLAARPERAALSKADALHPSALSDSTRLPMAISDAAPSGAMQRSGAESRYRRLAEQPESRRIQESTTESYGVLIDNAFKDVTHSPLSTMGIDVDTAAYSNVRRFLREGQLPPPDAVRIEELINYFTYDYAPPGAGEAPVRVHLEVAQCPWNTEHQLVRVALKARELAHGARPHANLVFLVDVSGSMSPENKLPLVKRSLRLLVERLGEADTVGIVTYAGNAQIALSPTSCDHKDAIYAAIDRLEAGSGTNGGEGIQGAYRMARDRFERSAVNRVLLCTDGDFNVGITSQGALTELIQREAKSGVFLSVLGFGMGNLKDSTMELLADKGNGHYAYIDSFSEARKVLSEQLEGTLVTVAKDVKIQIEFNPQHVARWRQIGYENRQLAARDFNDDRKDAGDAGAGQCVTALYEIVPAHPLLASAESPLRYQPRPRPTVVPETGSAHEQELLLVKVRYKLPDSDSSSVLEKALKPTSPEFRKASTDFQWASAVAGFGMLLRDSPHRGATSIESVLGWAQAGLGKDPQGFRSEFIDLVRRAQTLRER